MGGESRKRTGTQTTKKILLSLLAGLVAIILIGVINFYYINNENGLNANIEAIRAALGVAGIILALYALTIRGNSAKKTSLIVINLLIYAYLTMGIIYNIVVSGVGFLG